MSLQSIPYLVDIALCIDSTGSMSPVLDDVKRAALEMYTAIEKWRRRGSVSINCAFA